MKIDAMTPQKHREAIIRRKIKFGVKYPAIIWMFPKGATDTLIEELIQRVRPEVLANLQTQKDYEQWFEQTIQDPCWSFCVKGDVEAVRWGHIGKLINMAVYDILDRHQLTNEADRQRLWPWLHVPIDSIVQDYCKKLDPSFEKRKVLKGMTRDEYYDIQAGIRKAAKDIGEDPIWFEAVWSAERVME
jgi:hypothetical protein